MKRKKKLSRVWFALDSIKLSQFLKLVGKVFDIIPTYLSEEDLPLIEKYLRLRIVRLQNFVVERSHALLRDRAVRTKISIQIFRLVRFPFLAKVIERPKKTFRRVAVNLQRLLVRPFLIPEADKDEVLSVC